MSRPARFFARRCCQNDDALERRRSQIDSAISRVPTITASFAVRESFRDIVPMAPPVLPGPFTVDAYHRLAELGVFDEDDRVELLDGQIVAMTPIGGAHAACVIRLNNLLARRSRTDTAVSTQNPVVLSERWEPQPDIAVLRRPGGLGGAWLPGPQDVLLVIEVADTSL